MRVNPEPVLVVNGEDLAQSSGLTVPSDIGMIVRLPVSNGGSSDLVVDGSTTPVTFTYTSDASYNIRLAELRIILVAKEIKLDGKSFCGDNPLSNGIEVGVTDNWGTGLLGTIKLNEDFLSFPSRDGVNLNFNGKNDLLIASFDLTNSLVLRLGTSDNLFVRVNDDLTKKGYEIKFFQCYVYGVKES